MRALPIIWKRTRSTGPLQPSFVELCSLPGNASTEHGLDAHHGALVRRLNARERPRAAAHTVVSVLIVCWNGHFLEHGHEQPIGRQHQNRNDQRGDQNLAPLRLLRRRFGRVVECGQTLLQTRLERAWLRQISPCLLCASLCSRVLPRAIATPARFVVGLRIGALLGTVSVVLTLGIAKVT